MNVVLEFFGALSPADWIQTALLLLGVISLLWTASALKQQALATDFENYLTLHSQIAEAWRRHRDADEKAKEYELTEILNLLEACCHLHNKGVVRGTSREMVRDYLADILPPLFKNDYARKIIERSHSAPDTYFHIRRFALKQGLKGVPQQ
jgi:hypothetical protein